MIIIKNQILRIIGGIFIISLYYGGTHFLAAKEKGVPATPPTTSPTRPPKVTSALTPTPSVTRKVLPTTSPDDIGKKATGGVRATMGDINFRIQFNAHGGENPTGRFHYTDSAGKAAKGSVDICYFQEGNAAAFAGTIEGGTGEYKYILVKVQDNGEGRNNEADRLGVWFTEYEPSCLLDGYPAVAENGNLQVH